MLHMSMPEAKIVIVMCRQKGEGRGGVERRKEVMKLRSSEL